MRNPVVGHQGRCIDRQRARRLNSIRQLKAKRRAESRCALGDINIECDELPLFEHRAVAPCERLIARLQRTDQHLGDGDRRHCETQPPKPMSFEQGLEVRGQSRMAFQKIDDRG